MTVKLIRTAAAAILLAGVVCGVPAQAQTASSDYRASELKTAAGQQIVLKRIVRAANNACQGGRSLAEIRAGKACSAELVRQMVAGAHSPELTALAEGRSDAQLASVR